MKIPTQLRLVVLALMLTALNCTAQTLKANGFARLKSGIEGQVTIGPLCPSVGPGRPCSPNERPYQTTITVLSLHGRMLGEVETDTQGFFQMNLPPGTYILVPDVPETDPPGGRTWPWAESVVVEVEPRQVTDVEIHYDSGIR